MTSPNDIDAALHQNVAEKVYFIFFNLDDQSMHKLVGYCGQLLVDFGGVWAQESSMGVAWPAVYWWCMWSAVGVMAATLLWQRYCFKVSRNIST